MLREAGALFGGVSRKFVPGEAAIVSRSPPPPALDEFDRAILRILQKDNTVPQREIGLAVNLSAPAVQRRIRRMEAAGVIRANAALVDPTKVGRPLTIIVEVAMDSEKLELLDAAKRTFAATPAVQQCYYVTGDADFVLVVTVPTMADYETLTRGLFSGNHNVRRFRTLVVMDRVKAIMDVPV